MVHALNGNQSVNWWWLWEQLDPQLRPTKADYKKQFALLKCDAKLVSRMEQAGQSPKSVQILLSAVKRYGLAWGNAAGSSSPSSEVAQQPSVRNPAGNGKGRNNSSPSTATSPDLRHKSGKGGKVLEAPTPSGDLMPPTKLSSSSKSKNTWVTVNPNVLKSVFLWTVPSGTSQKCKTLFQVFLVSNFVKIQQLRLSKSTESKKQQLPLQFW